MNDTAKSWALGLGIGAAVVIGIYLASRAAKDKLGTALDVTSSDNAFASIVDKAGQKVSGDESWSLGVSIWRFFNGDEEKRSAEVGTSKDPNIKPKAKVQKKQGPTQGGAWSVSKPVVDDRPPSVLNPGQGGTGGSFGSQSSGPWSPY